MDHGSSFTSTTPAQEAALEILDKYLEAMKQGVEKESHRNAGYAKFLGLIKRSPDAEMLKVLKCMEEIASPDAKSESFSALEALKKRGSSVVQAASAEKPQVLAQLRFLGFTANKKSITEFGPQTVAEVVDSKEFTSSQFRALKEANTLGENPKRASNPKPMAIEVTVKPKIIRIARPESLDPEKGKGHDGVEHQH